MNLSSVRPPLAERLLAFAGRRRLQLLSVAALASAAAAGWHLAPAALTALPALLSARAADAERRSGTPGPLSSLACAGAVLSALGLALSETGALGTLSGTSAATLLFLGGLLILWPRGAARLAIRRTSPLGSVPPLDFLARFPARAKTGALFLSGLAASTRGALPGAALAGSRWATDHPLPISTSLAAAALVLAFVEASGPSVPPGLLLFGGVGFVGIVAMSSTIAERALRNARRPPDGASTAILLVLCGLLLPMTAVSIPDNALLAGLARSLAVLLAVPQFAGILFGDLPPVLRRLAGSWIDEIATGTDEPDGRARLAARVEQAGIEGELGRTGAAASRRLRP